MTGPLRGIFQELRGWTSLKNRSTRMEKVQSNRSYIKLFIGASVWPTDLRLLAELFCGMMPTVVRSNGKLLTDSAAQGKATCYRRTRRRA